MQSNTHRTRFSRTLFATISLGAISVTFAQVGREVPAQPVQPAVPRGGLNPDSFYAKESNQGVSVRDSLEAIKKLEDARRMERLRDWNKAADWYQEVVEKYGDRVVPSGVDKEGRQSQYTGIERPVQEQLAKWPREGLDSYRNRYGGVAKAMLDQARRDDRETLSKVMKLYFVTDAGKEAGVRLVDLLLENGEFPEAARVGDRLLDWHPNLEAERAKILFRTSLAYHLSGDAKRAKARADQMSAKYGDATGSLFGKDVVLADALGRLLQQTPPVSVATQTGSFRHNPGGDESRSQVMSSPGRSGARIASIDLADPPVMRGNPQQPPMEDFRRFGGIRGDMNSVGIGAASNLGVMPVVDDEELYFQDGSRVYAVSLQSGVPLPGWIQSYPSTNGQYAISSWSPFRTQQHTLTLTDQFVLGVMGAPERAGNYSVPSYGERGTRLVCLGRADGKEKWSVRKDKLPTDVLRGLDLSGSPLVVGDNVYVIGRGGKNMNAEDCYVLCFDLSSGAYKWSCFIASATNNYAFMGQPSMGDTLSHLAYSSGRVFVLTNLGACAALDAYSGTISWLNIYPREGAGADGGGWQQQMQFRRSVGGVQPTSVQSWEFNPVIVRDGKVFILPIDSRYVLVYDAGSGVEINKFALAEFRDALSSGNSPSQVPADQNSPQSLLAVDGKHLFVASEWAIYCIDWTKQVETVRERIEWGREFGPRLRGRPFVTNDSVFVSTETTMKGNSRFAGQLLRLARYTPKGEASGKVMENYPTNDRDWDAEGGEGPGNVVVSGDHVIIATAGKVNVYADMALARKRLDDDVAAAPHDPKPYLRYAEVMFVAGQLPVAMDKLDEVVKLLGGLESMRPGPERDHLFNDCITFALKLQRDKKLESADERVDSINKLYDLAAAAAHADSQQVNYRISRAKFNFEFRQPNSLTEAVRLYQEILSSPKLRTVPLIEPEAGAGATQAALVAERAIADIIKLKPEAYQQFEQQATAALEAAGKDPAALKSVAESYPNSAAAAKAMLAAAQAYEDQPDHRLATHTLRHAYSKYAQTQGADVKVRLLEGMARNYLAMPDRVDVTAARLSAVVRLGKESDPLEKPLTLPGGKVLVEAGTTFGQALKKVQAYTTEAAASKLPDFRMTPPLTPEQKKAFNEATLKWLEGKGDPAKKPVAHTPFLPPTASPVIENVQALLSVPRELRARHSRHDRVVAWSNGNLIILTAGGNAPAGQSSALTEAPRDIAWVDDGKSLLAWGNSQIALISGDNADQKWKLELKSLPKIEVISGGASADQVVANDDNQLGGEQQQILNGQRMVLRRRIINGRAVPQWQPVVPLPNLAIAPGGAEQILHVRPVDDRILVATSAGQLFALKAADGTLAWHTRLSSASPIERLVATDDFVVAMLTEGSSRQLVAIDTLNGQLVRRFNFQAETGHVPINLALAPDGMLVWITPDRLCGKDLFEPSKDLNYGDAPSDGPPNPNFNAGMNPGVGSAIFAGAVHPDQLLISEGRILVAGMDAQFVLAYSLESGRSLDHKDPNGRLVPTRFATSTKAGGGNWNVALHLVGPMLYVVSANAMPVAYELDSPWKRWAGSMGEQAARRVEYQHPLIDANFLMVLTTTSRGVAAPAIPPGAVPGRRAAVNPNVVQPVDAGAGAPQDAPTNWTFFAFSRVKPSEGDHKESGLLIYNYDLRDDAGISEFQGVDGGVYYLTADKKLKFLKGSRQ